MKQITIPFSARGVAALCSVALLFGGGLATVSAFTTQMMSSELPMVLPYQGTLAKDGMPVDGTQPNVVFKLHTSESGAARLWSSDSRTLDVKDGKFAVTLGDANDAEPLLPATFREPELYVSVTIDGTELLPRQRVAPTPQALNAREASNASGALRAELDTSAMDIANISGRVLANEARLVVTNGGIETTMNGLFCGITAAGTQGAISAPDPNNAQRPLTGYRAAKRLCETAANCSARAHMCTPSEMMVSAQLGLRPSTNSWVGSYTGADCNGWTTNQGAEGSRIVFTNAGADSFTNQASCATTIPIACCH